MARKKQIDPRQFANFLSATQDVLLKKHQNTKRPNKHTHRVAWNKHMERELELKFEFEREGIDYEDNDSRPMDEQRLRTIEECFLPLTGLSDFTRSLIRVQGQLIRSAVENIVYGTFEADWAALDIQKKKELALEGLYRGACAAPRDNSRVSCPEMTIRNLISDGKYNLINLLKRTIAHEPTGSGYIETYFFFTHPYIDDGFRLPDSASDSARQSVHQILLLRTYYISETLAGILDAFHGHPPQPILIARMGSNSNPSKGSCQPPEDYRIDNSQCREERAMLVGAVCYACQAVMEDRTQLKRCAKCQTVWYCSKECQTDDWPDHKKYCGAIKFDPNNYVPTPRAPPKFVGCPDPVPGFQRTPALYRQIEYLSRPDSTTRDYHLDRFYLNTRSIIVPDHEAPEKFVFLVARRRAMATGCVASVWRMYQTIEALQSQHQLPLDKILCQLEAEYNVKLFPPPTKLFLSPTPQELREEWDFCMRRRFGLSLNDQIPQNYRRADFATNPMWKNLS